MNDRIALVFNILKENGKIIVELDTQFFSSIYSSVEDRFGIR